MKKLILISIIVLSVVACKKTKFAPEGPTKVRVENVSVSDTTFLQVIVKTSASGVSDTLGNISPGDFTDYFLFDKAFPKAEISAKFNGQTFTTGTVDYTGMTYIGQAKITYEVRISDYTNRKLKIIHCSLDAPLD